MKLKTPFLIAVNAAALLLIAAGCGRERETADRIIQGEPIQGEPIAAPASPSTNGVAPVTAGAAAQSALAAGLIPDQPLGYQVMNEAPKNVEPGYTAVGFDRLAGYKFELTDDLLLAAPEKLAEATKKTNEQIPADVRKLDGEKIAMMGFMLPLKVDTDSGLVTEFLIMRDQSACCFGSVPAINEWVSVKMVAKGVRPMMDQPVTLYGKLRVGEERENGYLVGIYQLEGEKMAGPQDM